MKKFFAAAVAVLLAVGLTAVGFAQGATADTASAPVVSPATPVRPATAAEPAAADESAAAAATPAIQPSECVASVSYSYSYVAGASSGTITVTPKDPANTLTKLCSTLFVRAASWTYDLPTNGDSPSFGQTLEVTLDTTVTSIGQTSYRVPSSPTGCRQHDVYASFVSMAALTLPKTLSEKGDPLEPPFLSTTLANSGPDKTYTFDSSADCTVVAPVTAAIIGTCSFNSGLHASFVPVQIVYNNTASNVAVNFSVANASLGRRVAAGKTVTVDFPDAPVTGESWVVRAGAHTITLTMKPIDPCPITPPSPPVAAVSISADPSATDQACVSTTSQARVSGSITVLPDTGLVYRIRPVLPSGADLTNVAARTPVEPGSYLVIASALDGYTLGGSPSQFPEVVMAAAGCISTASLPVADPRAGVLAVTGARDSSAFLWGGGILTMLGAGAVVTSGRLRRGTRRPRRTNRVAAHRAPDRRK